MGVPFYGFAAARPKYCCAGSATDPDSST